jgi:hypothetical protein
MLTFDVNITDENRKSTKNDVIGMRILLVNLDKHKSYNNAANEKRT